MPMKSLPGVYFGFRHHKALFDLERIEDINMYEVAVDPNHYGYLRVFKLRKDGTKYSKSMPLHTDSLHLFKDKIEARDYLEKHKDDLDKKIQSLADYVRKNSEYLDGVQFP